MLFASRQNDHHIQILQNESITIDFIRIQYYNLLFYTFEIIIKIESYFTLISSRFLNFI